MANTRAAAHQHPPSLLTPSPADCIANSQSPFVHPSSSQSSFSSTSTSTTPSPGNLQHPQSLGASPFTRSFFLPARDHRFPDNSVSIVAHFNKSEIHDALGAHTRHPCQQDALSTHQSYAHHDRLKHFSPDAAVAAARADTLRALTRPHLQVMSPESPTSSPPSLSSSRSSVRSSSSTLRSVSFPDDDDEDRIAEAENEKPLRAALQPVPLIRPCLPPSKSTGAARTAVSPGGLRETASRNLYARHQRQPTSPPNGFEHSTLSPSSPYSRPSPQRSRTLPSRKSMHISPRLHNDAFVIPQKRMSWLQPSATRKTTKELEAEYDELDDDLPEDLIVYNIPLSPRPLHTRSLSGSVENLPLPKPVSPVLPRRSSPERGDLKARPTHSQRTKSWTQAMNELSEDVRKLTVALESHFDSAPKRSLTKRPKSPKIKTEVSVTPAPVEPPIPTPEPALPKPERSWKFLPPIQNLGLSLESIPASKEKEKVLTRTRPSWLPPKSPKEDRKHLREWEKMMARCRGMYAKETKDPMVTVTSVAT